MPAVSKAQRKAFGIARAIQKGEAKPQKGTPSGEIAKSVKPSDVKKFAKTPESGLPQRVKKETYAKLKEMIRPLVHKLMKKNKVDESKASEDAKRKGLEYLGFGRYGKDKKQTHIVKNDKLVPVSKSKEDDATGPGDIVGRNFAKGGPQSDTEKTKKTKSDYKTRMNKYEYSSDQADNFWRDAFFEKKANMTDADIKKILKSHPSLKTSFISLADPKQQGGAYIQKTKSGNWTWPEMQPNYPEEPFTKFEELISKVPKWRKSVSELKKLEEALGRKLTVPEKHQLAIAYKTMNMSDAMVGVMGGPNKEQSKQIIKQLTGHDYKERKDEGSMGRLDGDTSDALAGLVYKFRNKGAKNLLSIVKKELGLDLKGISDNELLGYIQDELKLHTYTHMPEEAINDENTKECSLKEERMNPKNVDWVLDIAKNHTESKDDRQGVASLINGDLDGPVKNFKDLLNKLKKSNFIRGNGWLEFNKDLQNQIKTTNKISLKESARPLSQIASEIYRDWKNVNYAAKPYLEAMRDLNSIHDKYMMDDGSSIVLYFLSNASSWRGETAKRIKKELNDMLKMREAYNPVEDPDNYMKKHKYGFSPGENTVDSSVPFSGVQEAWTGWNENMLVQVVGVKDGKITADGSGEQIFKNLADAKKWYSVLDPDKNTEEFTWATKGKVHGHDAIRFETWKAYKSLSTEAVSAKPSTIIKAIQGEKDPLKVGNVWVVTKDGTVEQVSKEQFNAHKNDYKAGPFYHRGMASNYIQDAKIQESSKCLGVIRALVKEALGQRSFNTDVDMWFDDVTDFASGKEGTIALEDRALDTLRKLVKASPTAQTLDKIRLVIGKLFGGRKQFEWVRAQAARIINNNYKGEFKSQYGQHSQTSEFLSMLRQALNYDKTEDLKESDDHYSISLQALEKLGWSIKKQLDGKYIVTKGKITKILDPKIDKIMKEHTFEKLYLCRWVYGTRDDKWHLVDKKDRDFEQGITQDEMKKLGKEKAKAKYLQSHRI